MEINMRSVNNKKGFTLIEMIGVIAVVAILATFVAPKVFKVVKEAKPAKFAAQTKTYATSITDWYKDIGTLMSINTSGTTTATDTSFEQALMSSGGLTTGLWANWAGPYIDSVATGIGTKLTIETNTGKDGVTAAVNSEANSFDLNDDDKNDMDGQQVVTLKVTAVTSVDFDAVDAIIDRGLTSARKDRSGKVKYSGTDLYLYLTSE